MRDKYTQLIYFVGGSLLFFGSGISTYYIFKTKLLFILLFILGFEMILYLIYKKKFIFIRRFLLNIFYLAGYFFPLCLK